MEDYSKLFEPYQRYLDTLGSEDKIMTALKFISENPDCSTDVVAMAVEKQNA
jgi:hypothetical protein